MYSKNLYNNLPDYIKLLDAQDNIIYFLCEALQTELDVFEKLSVSRPDYINVNTGKSFNNILFLQQFIGLGNNNGDNVTGTGVDINWSYQKIIKLITQAQDYFKIKGTEKGYLQALNLWLDLLNDDVNIIHPYYKKINNNFNKVYSLYTPFNAHQNKPLKEINKFGGDYDITKTHQQIGHRLVSPYCDFSTVFSNTLQSDKLPIYQGLSGVNLESIYTYIKITKDNWDSINSNIHYLDYTAIPLNIINHKILELEYNFHLPDNYFYSDSLEDNEINQQLIFQPVGFDWLTPLNVSPSYEQINIESTQIQYFSFGFQFHTSFGTNRETQTETYAETEYQHFPGFQFTTRFSGHGRINQTTDTFTAFICDQHLSWLAPFQQVWSVEPVTLVRTISANITTFIYFSEIWQVNYKITRTLLSITAVAEFLPYTPFYAAVNQVIETQQSQTITNLVPGFQHLYQIAPNETTVGMVYQSNNPTLTSTTTEIIIDNTEQDFILFGFQWLTPFTTIELDFNLLFVTSALDQLSIDLSSVGDVDFTNQNLTLTVDLSNYNLTFALEYPNKIINLIKTLSYADFWSAYIIKNANSSSFITEKFDLVNDEYFDFIDTFNLLNPWFSSDLNHATEVLENIDEVQFYNLFGFFSNLLIANLVSAENNNYQRSPSRLAIIGNQAAWQCSINTNLGCFVIHPVNLYIEDAVLYVEFMFQGELYFNQVTHNQSEFKVRSIQFSHLNINQVFGFVSDYKRLNRYCDLAVTATVSI